MQLRAKIRWISSAFGKLGQGLLFHPGDKGIVANLLPHAVYLFGIRPNQIPQLGFAVSGSLINPFGQEFSSTAAQPGTCTVGHEFTYCSIVSRQAFFGSHIHRAPAELGIHATGFDDLHLNTLCTKLIGKRFGKTFSFIRLFGALSDPIEAAFLGELIIDEIYFRLLSNERGGELRHLLQQRGEIQRISRAVEYIHQNLDQRISVGQLAKMVHMGQTSFYQNFRNVMHMSPLQYVKSVKLHKAQALIREGKKANEAGYLVGYNSPAQFSREYKRHFGFAPSAT
jgi:AraC-like DNA-binding protein